MNQQVDEARAYAAALLAQPRTAPPPPDRGRYNRTVVKVLTAWLWGPFWFIGRVFGAVFLRGRCR